MNVVMDEWAAGYVSRMIEHGIQYRIGWLGNPHYTSKSERRKKKTELDQLIVLQNQIKLALRNGGAS